MVCLCDGRIRGLRPEERKKREGRKGRNKTVMRKCHRGWDTKEGKVEGRATKRREEDRKMSTG